MLLHDTIKVTDARCDTWKVTDESVKNSMKDYILQFSHCPVRGQGATGVNQECRFLDNGVVVS